MSDQPTRRVFVETGSGDRFEADVPCGTKISKLAADFFVSQGWPQQDRRGRGQRAVVEVVNPDDPDDTKRLNSDADICESVHDGATLRVFPEAIAGAVDQRARLTALVADFKDMQALQRQSDTISFTANRTHAPDLYEITLRCTSFVELPPGQPEPLTADVHRVEITLAADYPRRAPIVRWLTPIFHPNISQQEGAVCLGVLKERYLPGLGLGRLVRMLAEMVQWRNFDPFNAFNREAAQWAAEPAHWATIHSIGGHPLQGPIGQFIAELDRASQAPITFRRVSAEP